MASTANLRIRRSAAELAALAGVEREIRTQDNTGRRKYLQDFTRAFRTYRSVLEEEDLRAAAHAADIVLIGDYHALPASQQFCASLFEDRAQPADRPVVLGLETIFARDQHVIDEWWRREISEHELRQRIRFDIDWGYDWAPFYSLLVTAREHGEALYGLDCMPREDLRKIGARDRHAAHKIAEIRTRHPNAVIVVLFGESHLAPGHLPRQLRKQLANERILTVLQNVDALYWRAAGEPLVHVPGVQVNDDVVCTFSSTPLEKYENYRLHLSRWGRGDHEGPDLAPTIYNLIDSLAVFLGINRYSSTNSTQPRFLVDMLPEVYGPEAAAQVVRALTRAKVSEDQIELYLERAGDQGCVYMPQINAIFVREFHMMYVAEEAARFLHHACQGLPARSAGTSALLKDALYVRVLEQVFGYFGSRTLYPARPAVEGKEYEIIPGRASSSGRQPELGAELLGSMMANALYDAYLEGHVTPQTIRRWMLVHLDEAGAARKTYEEIARKLRRRPKGRRSIQ
ncbi:MAG TPA: ChaN family lipoprotein [Terriglobales bacterium]|jgi:Haem-binding uptake, Tiki superfamily, ChaN|nr:ChaN family lipoprotein [Terriglobales bacterium]